MTYLLFDSPKKLIKVKTVPKIIVRSSDALQCFSHGALTDLESYVFILPRFIALQSTYFIFII